MDFGEFLKYENLLEEESKKLASKKCSYCKLKHSKITPYNFHEHSIQFYEEIKERVLCNLLYLNKISLEFFHLKTSNGI